MTVSTDSSRLITTRPAIRIKHPSNEFGMTRQEKGEALRLPAPLPGIKTKIRIAFLRSLRNPDKHRAGFAKQRRPPLRGIQKMTKTGEALRRLAPLRGIKTKIRIAFLRSLRNPDKHRAGFAKSQQFVLISKSGYRNNKNTILTFVGIFG